MNFNNMKLYQAIILCCAGWLSVSEASAQERLSLSLAQCREMALSQSEELQLAGNRLRQAELDNEIATTAYLPKIDGSAIGVYMFPDMDMMGMDLRMRGTYMAGVNLTQPIYTGGKITTGKRLARIGGEVAREQQRMTRMDVLVEADKAYWTYIAVARKVRMLESFSAQMDTLYRQVSAACRAGMTTENDLLRIEVERSDVLYQLQKAKNGEDLCRMSVCRIIGVGFDTSIEPTDTLITFSEPTPLSTDISSRPEMTLLEKQIEADKQQIRMAKADMLPTVGLTAGYMYYGNIKLEGMTVTADGTSQPFSQEFRDGQWTAMLSVSIPIFHWGENRKKVRKARYQLKNSELELQKNTRLINIEVQQSIRNMQDGQRLVQTAETGLCQAKENLRVTQNRYASSVAPLSDLLDAQSQWQQAESNLIEAQTQCKIYETEYLRATGNL